MAAHFRRAHHRNEPSEKTMTFQRKVIASQHLFGWPEGPTKFTVPWLALRMTGLHETSPSHSLGVGGSGGVGRLLAECTLLSVAWLACRHSRARTAADGSMRAGSSSLIASVGGRKSKGPD